MSAPKAEEGVSLDAPRRLPVQVLNEGGRLDLGIVLEESVQGVEERAAIRPVGTPGVLAVERNRQDSVAVTVEVLHVAGLDLRTPPSDAIHRTPGSANSGTTSWLTAPSAGHMPRGAQPKRRS